MSVSAGFLQRGASVLIDCQVHIPEFEGPLDLLLHLIKNNELDLQNLQIAQITSQYLAYLDYMREMNLDLASEYLVMAATLTYLKSQIIVPQEKKTEASGSDPRAQLIRRLIELKNYKDLAAQLATRPRLFRDTFLARNTGIEEIQDGLEPEVALTNPYQLVEAYRALVSRRKEVVHAVYTDTSPIATCVDHIVEQIKLEERITFQKLLPEVARPIDVISMFLGVLETSRIGMTGIEQEGVFTPIVLHRRMDPEALEQAKKDYNITMESDDKSSRRA